MILWWFGCYELVLKQMGYEVLTMKVYVSWGFAFCTSSVWYITSMSYEVEFNCDIYIYIYVCVCVCVCVCIKFVKSETLLKLFCSSGHPITIFVG